MPKETAPAWGTLGPSEGVPWGRLRHDSDVGSQSAAAINFCVSYGEWSLLILRVTPFPNGALILPWDVRRRTTDGAPRFTFGAGVSLASALACSFAFCGASMVDWLVRDFTIFGVLGQNWMLIEIAIILIGSVLSWWLQR
jgi:hypothetical protein